MIIIPAIDLRGGVVVRLTQGSFEQETLYSSSPAETMRTWQDEGAKWVHVVDLDGARDGKLKNLEALHKILEVARIPIQFGGGLRDATSVATILATGVARVVIGTKAFDPLLLEMLINQHGEKIAVGVDIREGRIQTHGWQSDSGQKSVESYCLYLQASGVQTIIVTDISRDGTLEGPNFDLLDEMLKTTKVHIILSGGVSSLDDLKRLAKVQDPKFLGVIVGKALYEKKFLLPEAIEKFEGSKS